MMMMKMVRIPLRDTKGNIVEYALIDEADLEAVNKYKWSLDKKKSAHGNKELFYAIGWVEGIRMNIHVFLLGKSDNTEESVIDHKDGNGLNNSRSNLRHATIPQNGQNMYRIKKDTDTSKYTGVGTLPSGKWRARVGETHIGTFDTEIEAAGAYDIYVLEKYGEDAHTNGIVKSGDDLSKKIEKLDVKKLPKNITLVKGNYYSVRIARNSIKYNLGRFLKLEDAEKTLKKFLDKKEEEDEEALINLPITRDENNQAYIQCSNVNEKILVDEEMWHDLMRSSWIRCDKGYAKNRQKGYMHRIIMNPKDNEKVDHKNRAKLDNRTVNLRIATSRQNNHNRTKTANSTSKYFGVCWSKSHNKWETYVHFEGKKTYGGSYKDEIEAAKAYNEKATEFYGDFANLNLFDE